MMFKLAGTSKASFVNKQVLTIQVIDQNLILAQTFLADENKGKMTEVRYAALERGWSDKANRTKLFELLATILVSDYFLLYTCAYPLLMYDTIAFVSRCNNVYRMIIEIDNIQ
jgi:hypothetical protein